MNIKDRITKIKNILDEKKAENIEDFNLEDTEYFAKAVIIATALVDRHGYALLDELKKTLKGEEEFLRIEDSKEWIIIDMGDILVHIMNKETRDRFNLEEFLSTLK